MKLDLKKLVHETLSDELKDLGFTMRYNRFYYKYENGLIYRFGTHRDDMLCEILPDFCAVDFTGPANNNYALVSSKVNNELMNALYYNADEEYAAGIIRRMFSQYVRPYIERITSIEDSEKDQLNIAMLRVRGRLEGDGIHLPDDLKSIPDSQELMYIYIYYKKYEELGKMLLATKAMYYEWNEVEPKYYAASSMSYGFGGLLTKQTESMEIRREKEQIIAAYIQNILNQPTELPRESDDPHFFIPMYDRVWAYLRCGEEGKLSELIEKNRKTNLEQLKKFRKLK